MGGLPYIVLTALMLLVAFLIGCGIGWFARTRMFGLPQPQPSSDTKTGPRTAAPASTGTKSVSSTDEPGSAAGDMPVGSDTGPEADPAGSARPAASTVESSKPSTKAETSDTQRSTKSGSRPAPTAEEGTQPEALSAPRGKKDNLKRISGVGPKIEGQLNANGIYHFDQIAAWNADNIAWIDSNLSFRGRIQRDDWVGQARRLAEENRA